jgi:hypothetical protein
MYFAYIPLMKRSSKIFLTVVAVLILVSVSAYVYLFVDMHKYPASSTDSLQKFITSEIAEGKSVSVADSSKKNIIAEGEWFKDATGRVMNLRGINVSGSSKVPFLPLMPTHVKDGFFESAKTVSFVGRPFPVEEADLHFSRLAQWGFQFVRLLISWEAIEHEGPGIYDQAYLDYVYQIVKKAQDHNINVFIDPHQDVWSRFTGGDGAPLWTLEKAGFDPTKFPEAGAAIVHNVQGDPFPKMIWPTNYSKLGAATMFTLFFAGKDFAPQSIIENVNIQDYLQEHYINAVRQVAVKLKDLPNVIGFDTLNEPSAGYIGISNLDTLGLLKIGPMPNYYQGMVAGDGNTVNVSIWEFNLGFKQVGEQQINSKKLKVWKDGAHDIWQVHKVWGYEHGRPVLLKPDYFAMVNGHQVDFSADYWKPFAIKFTNAIHEIDKRWLIFAESAIMTKLPAMEKSETENFVNAGHWYDGVTLMSKKNMKLVNADVEKAAPIFGKKVIREYLQGYLGQLKNETKTSIGDHPTLIGEFGIPFDLDDRIGFTTGDFSEHEDALNRSLMAMESNLLNYTLWNYTPDNDNDHGDQWNGEDLSVFSLSQQKNRSDLNSGGRALATVIRPYPYKISGRPLLSFFNPDKVEYVLKFSNDTSMAAPTEIFVPRYHFEKGFEVFVTKGKLAFDRDRDLLLYFPEGSGDHEVVLKKTN